MFVPQLAVAEGNRYFHREFILKRGEVPMQILARVFAVLTLISCERPTAPPEPREPPSPTPQTQTEAGEVKV